MFSYVHNLCQLNQPNSLSTDFVIQENDDTQETILEIPFSPCSDVIQISETFDEYAYEYY